MITAFINCPYDENYKDFFRRIIYICYKFDVEPRFASDTFIENNRMDKIVEFLDSCDIGIHDISRTEFTGSNTLPRFNMPFELGLDYLFKKKVKPHKKILILDKKAYQYTKTISDLACLDVEYHDDNKTKLLNLIRKFFVDYFELTETASPQKLEVEFETEFLLWLSENLLNHQFNGISELEMHEYKLKVKKYFTMYPEKIEKNR